MSKLDAQAFLIWRFANPKEWDVSYDQIAEATGLTRRQVDVAIQAKRWGGRIGRGRQEDRGGGPRYSQFKRGANVDINALDLTQLMEGQLPASMGAEE